MAKLLQLLTNAQAGQREQQHPSAVTPTDVEPVEKEQIAITPLTTRFSQAIVEKPGSLPLDLLIESYDGPATLIQGDALTDAISRVGAEPAVVYNSESCLLLLGRAKTTPPRRSPLVIAHSLLGDHR